MSEGTMGSVQFTEEDAADLKAMRAEREARKAAEAEAEAEAKKNAPPISHRLLLADGRVIESAGTMTSYDGIAVIQSTPVEEGFKASADE
jgi:hypothetical protein